MPYPVWETLIAMTRDNPGNTAPSASESLPSHLQHFDSTEPSAEQRKNAVDYCFLSGHYYAESGNLPFACDWLVAASECSELENAFTDNLLIFFNKSLNATHESWPQFFHNPPKSIDRRLLAITLIRIISSIGCEMDRAVEMQFIKYITETCPDICRELGIESKAETGLQRQAFAEAEKKSRSRLHPVFELRDGIFTGPAIVQRFHGIQQAFNNRLVKAMTTPYLPDGFVKTTLPALTTAFSELVSVGETGFLAAVDSTTTELGNAKARACALPTYYSQTLLLPFIDKLCRESQRIVAESDVTKGAKVLFSLYPRKYPLHLKGGTTLLRFLVENAGPGPANDLELRFHFFGLTPEEKVYRMTSVQIGKERIEFEVEVTNPQTAHEFSVQWSWNNFDRSTGRCEGVFELGRQNENINWDELRSQSPYSTDAISSESERPFVGRESDLRELMRNVVRQPMGSAFIYGQRRVGKTSLGNELASRAEAVLDAKSRVYSIYVDSNKCRESTAGSTLRRLVDRLIRLMPSLTAIEHIPKPGGNESLGPFIDYLEAVFRILPNIRLLIIVDEFDELPIELYKPGPIGDTFFLQLRAITEISNVGMVLIGGENMKEIRSAQADRLNRFTSLSLDYFRRAEHWHDYCELVKAPVKNLIEYSDEAIERLYAWTMGNPYFTNLIGIEIFNSCDDRKDAYVSALEVEECARKTYEKTDLQSFAHFWKDQTLGSESRKEEISILRRRVFLAIAATVRAGKLPTLEQIANESIVASESQATVANELNQLVQRSILTEHNGTYRCRVKLFERFLAERSQTLMSTDFVDMEERRRVEEEETRAYVKDTEIIDLLQKWGNYNPQPVTEMRVRAWLEQFESNRDKRVMFELLTGIQFFNERQVREQMITAMNYVKRKSVGRMKQGERSRHDVLVTYLGGVAKSGTQYARMFCEENGILKSNAASSAAIAERLSINPNDFTSIVALDDIFGTGQSAVDGLTELDREAGDLIRRTKIPVFAIAICGFQTAVEDIESKLETLQFEGSTYVLQSLNEDQKVFSEKNNAFSSSANRARAKEIALDKGAQLEKKFPLGFGHCEAGIVFFMNCPNNSLPILYKKSTTWQPLFPRV